MLREVGIVGCDFQTIGKIVDYMTTCYLTIKIE